MQILRRLESIRAREHGATVELIEALVECQRTRAYADAGYDSTWKLLVSRLLYSPAAASRRVAAMRCVMRCPRALDLLRARRTTLSALHSVAKTLCTTDDPDALLDAIDGATQTEVETIVARHRPVACTVERVKRKTVRRSAPRPVVAPSPDERELFASIDTEAKPDPPTEDRVQLTFSLSTADHARLEAARRRLSGKFPAGVSIEQLFLELLAVHEAKSSPKPRPSARSAPSSAPEPRTRHVPAATRRAVFRRDGGACTFVADDGTHCGSRHDLEIDHVVPWARGGSHDATNLRVLCATHNRRRAELTFGARSKRQDE